jgi:hypothetical protein
VTTSTARVAAFSALAIGIAGDLLLRGPWYLGFVGVVYLILGAAWAVTGAAEGARTRSLVLGLTALAAAGLILRDDPMLYFFDLVAVLSGLALVVWLQLGRGFARFRVRDAFRAWFAAAYASVVKGPSTLVREPQWPRPVSSGDRRARLAAGGAHRRMRDGRAASAQHRRAQSRGPLESAEPGPGRPGTRHRDHTA